MTPEEITAIAAVIGSGMAVLGIVGGILGGMVLFGRLIQRVDEIDNRLENVEKWTRTVSVIHVTDQDYRHGGD